MKAVKFIRAHLMYQPGETAGFEDSVADGLIARGIARDPAKPIETEEATPDVVIQSDPASGQSDGGGDPGDGSGPSDAAGEGAAGPDVAGAGEGAVDPGADSEANPDGEAASGETHDGVGDGAEAEAQPDTKASPAKKAAGTKGKSGGA